MLQSNNTCVIDYLKFIVGLIKFRIGTMKINHVRLINSNSNSNPNSKSNLNLNKTIKEINVDDEQLQFKN